MNVYKRFFRITAGPLFDAAKCIEQERSESIKIIEAFCKEIGATAPHTYSDGRVAGFEFDGVACSPVWGSRDSCGLRMPRGNTKDGKALRERIKALPRVPSLNDALKTVGLAHDIPAVIAGNRWYASAAFGAPSLGVMFISVPWRDIDPAELDEYRRRNAAGTHTSIELDHLLWTPTADMVEVKEWEVQREIDQLNAQVKARAAA